jgi:hypothetical protein
MELSSGGRKGCPGGYVAVTDILSGTMTSQDLEQALSALKNINKVTVSSMMNAFSTTFFTVEFTLIFKHLYLSLSMKVHSHLKKHILIMNVTNLLLLISMIYQMVN